MSAYPCFELSFRPTDPTISGTRRLVTALVEDAVADAEVAYRAGLAAHELLENGAKYSVDGMSMICVEVSRVGRGRVVTVEVRNTVTPAARLGLTRAFEEMHSYPDVNEFYQFAMLRTRTLAGGSRLGLARIQAEGEMSLSLVCDGNEVRVIASLALNEAPEHTLSRTRAHDAHASTLCRESLWSK